VETKLASNQDDLLVFQGLDYYVWARAYREVLVRRLALSVAGRLFFPVHRSQFADFSIGPGIGLQHVTHDPDGDGGQGRTSTNPIHLEGAAQIRAFIVPNVALSATAGLGVVVVKDNNSATISGQQGAAFGVTYFFF